MNLYNCVYSLSCFRDEPVLLFEFFFHVSHVKQVPAETVPTCDTSRLAENSHQSLHGVQVRLALLYSLGYALHQTVGAAHKETASLFIMRSKELYGTLEPATLMNINYIK